MVRCILPFSLCCILPVLPSTLFALDPHKRVTQYVHDVWQVKDGLPQNSVTQIVQTRDGYLWLGTFEGLVRFDGVHFEVFDKSNTPQLKSNFVNALIEGSDGSLWIGTDAGLNRFKAGKFTLYTTKEGLSHDAVNCLSEARDASLWIGTKRGLNRFKQGKLTSYNLKNGLTNEIFDIKHADDGGLWIGSYGGGLSLFHNERFTHYSVKDGLPNPFVNKLYLTQDRNLWIGARKGLSRFRNGKFTTFTIKDGLSGDVIRSFCEDRDGNFWIGTADGGLQRLEKGTFSHYTTREGLSDDLVHSLYEDREGSLWIGTDGGLNRLKDGRFITYSKQEGLSHDYVLSVYEDHDKNLWIGTRGGGLNLLRDGNFTVFTTTTGLISDFILSIAEDRKGNLWVGTRDGLNRLTDRKSKHFTTKDGLSDDFVCSLHADRSDTLWAGTFAGGLSQFEKERFKTYSTENGLSDNLVAVIVEDSKGGLWIGTEAGLNFLKDGEIRQYPICGGSTGKQVNAIYQDRPDSLWIGISESGLRWLNSGKCTSFTTKEGIPHDDIFAILEDAVGNLWMSCNKGVFRVQKRELEDFAKGKTTSVHSVLYDEADGMKSRECNGGYQPVAWKGRDGKLWFATTKGVVVIDPQTIKSNRLIPPVHIEKIIVDNEIITISSGAADRPSALMLSPGKEKFEFHYTALSFLTPPKVEFKYKLEGFDKEWVDAGSRRIAYYTHIPPGQYKFRVIACNNDGKWNDAGASFGFYLKPFFHQTGWFYGMCFLGLVVIGGAMHRVHIRRVKERFYVILGERTRIARDLHDTLAQNISTVVVQLDAAGESIIESPEQSKKFLTQAQELARESVMQVRKAIMELRDDTSLSKDLATSLRQAASRITEPQNISVYVKKQGEAMRLSNYKEDQIVRICEEAVRNAVKHAHPEKIDVELTFGKNQIELCIRDDGTGFDVDLAPKDAHFGLTGIQERTEHLGGAFRIHSRPGYGTEIRIQIPHP